jgi:cytidyltransferase-like protein
MKIVLATGGFDPIHSGHIDYLEAAKRLGNKLVVGLNSDDWLDRKKGQAFMPFSERQRIIQSLHMVDMVIGFDDSDGTAKDAITQTRRHYPMKYVNIIFANGGDRTADNIPEMSVPDVEFVFGVGGENKANSSSWILQEWRAPKTERPWGYYRVLHETEGTKVKELTVNPGKSLRMQKHQQRSELWHVAEGKCVVEQIMYDGHALPKLELEKYSQLVIPVNDWHQLSNPFDVPCKIIEIQYGSECIESDIEVVENK